MTRFLILFVIIVVLQFSYHIYTSYGANYAASELTFEQDHFELGRLPDGEVINLDVPIYNTGTADLLVSNLRAACGCTYVSVDDRMIAPGEMTVLHIRLDTSFKSGDFAKTVSVFSNAPGSPHLVYMYADVYLITPDNHPRTFVGANIFGGSCATCHAAVDHGVSASQLYQSVCAMCHGQDRAGGLDGRAPALTPTLLRQYYYEEDVEYIISYGVEGSSMPGFASSYGGPLSDHHIRSLIRLIWGN